jgi:hypothetical protein
MNGLDAHYTNMLADHQRMLDEQAQKEEEQDQQEDLTSEDMAFMTTYLRCVAVGTREDVVHFLRPTNKYVMPDYIFTSIEDAWLVWDEALKFARGKTK